MNVDEDLPLEAPKSPEFQPAPTKSGRQRRFPRHYHDYLPNSSTQIPPL